MSQRELAELAQLPRTTIDRIEAGRSDPRVSTLTTILAAVGFELGVQLNGHAIDVDLERERLVDGGGRHFPSHWEVREVHWIDGYWGWWRKDPKLRAFPPSHTYWKRGYSSVRWMDAT